MIGPAPVLTGTRPRISGWVVNKIRVDITSQQRICHSSEAPVCRALRVLVKQMTEIVVSAAGDPRFADRTWVLIHESPDGGWGIDGHAYTGADIAAAARRELTGQ